jgi:hypothetical protein
VAALIRRGTDARSREAGSCGYGIGEFGANACWFPVGAQRPHDQPLREGTVGPLHLVTGQAESARVTGSRTITVEWPLGYSQCPTLNPSLASGLDLTATGTDS